MKKITKEQYHTIQSLMGSWRLTDSVIHQNNRKALKELTNTTSYDEIMNTIRQANDQIMNAIIKLDIPQHVLISITDGYSYKEMTYKEYQQ